MNIIPQKNIGKTIDVTASNRPLKIAYIVSRENSPINNMILDAVFYESYTRWAGVYTLIIPSDSQNFFDASYEDWLEFFDPDFVYTFIGLENELVEKIDRLCSPIAFLEHKMHESETADLRWEAFIPRWGHYFTPVSSMTTVSSPYAQYPFFNRQEPQGEISIITQYGIDVEYRLIRDNFGTAFQLEHATHEIPGLFKTLCFTHADLPSSIIVGSERCNSIADLLAAISGRNAAPIAKFAMAHSETIPRVSPREWARGFNIFIGNTPIDRINFWNSRHFVPSHDTSLGAVILDIKFFDDEILIKQLGVYLSANNYLGQEHGQAKVTIRSYSHDEKELCLIQEKLSKKTHNSIIVGNTFNLPVLPPKNDLNDAFFVREADTHILKLNEDKNVLAAKEPDHFTFLPARYRGLGQGSWVVVLDIQRHNNLSRFSNVIESWELPRRQGVSQVFTDKLGKVTRCHRLALIPTTPNFPFPANTHNIKYSYNLFLPDDEFFFRQLVLYSSNYLNDDLRVSANVAYQDISISDKGQNLRGVISMFDDISSAYKILTNKYWRVTLRKANDDSIRYLVFDRDELDGLIPSDRITKNKIKEELRLSDIGSAMNYMRANLTDTLEYLIRRRVFFQVHQWRCKYCGHMNSRSLDEINIKNNCEICGSEYFVPIDLEWKYQLNDFVYRSLVKNTGLPVLWSLGYLQNRMAKSSFWYLPEVDLYEDINDKNRKNEIDILCVIDGKFYAIEVKLSSSLMKKEGEIEKFVNKINLISPDVAMLFFEQYCKSDDDILEAKAWLHQCEIDMRKAINSNIRLRVVVGDNVGGFNDHPADLGYIGGRTRKYD